LWFQSVHIILCILVSHSFESKRIGKIIYLKDGTTTRRSKIKSKSTEKGDKDILSPLNTSPIFSTKFLISFGWQTGSLEYSNGNWVLSENTLLYFIAIGSPF